MRGLFAALSVPAFLAISLFDMYGISVRVGVFIGHEYWKRQVPALFKWGVLVSSALLLVSCVRPQRTPALVARALGIAGLFGGFIGCWRLSNPVSSMLISAQLFFCLSVCAWIPGLAARPRTAGALLALTILPMATDGLNELSHASLASLESVAFMSWRVCVIFTVLLSAWLIGRKGDVRAVWVGLAWSAWETTWRLAVLREQYRESLGAGSRPLDFVAWTAGEAGWLCAAIVLVVLLVLELRCPAWRRTAGSDPSEGRS